LAYKLEFRKSVAKDLKKIDKFQTGRILEALKTDLVNNPGKDKELTGNHSGLYSYRIGDYRVIYSLIDQIQESGEEGIIDIQRIGHRKNIYD
jgi:mRNA interferase RelE/StbE